MKTIANIYRKVKVSRRSYLDYILSWFGGFLGIGILGFVSSLAFTQQESIFLIGSFGASAILIFGEPKSPFSQPRNLIGGHVISAFIGVTIASFIGSELWLAAALAVSISLIVMKLTKTIHPPGGATSLIAVIGGEKISKLGYWFMIFPVASGAIILLLIAYLTNNLHGSRKYPEKWI